jgi:hypothetical protein
MQSVNIIVNEELSQMSNGDFCVNDVNNLAP